MGLPGTNNFIHHLSEIFRTQPVRQKLLLGPSLRVCHQWTDRAAASGAPVLNVRPATLRTCAVSYASAKIEAAGQKLLSGLRQEMFCSRVFELARESGKLAYLKDLSGGSDLASALTRTITDLRLAGLNSDTLKEEAFESPDKAADLRLLLSLYEKEAAALNITDYADALKEATNAIRGGAFPSGSLFIAPENYIADLKGLELDFWNSLPKANRIEIGAAAEKDSQNYRTRKNSRKAPQAQMSLFDLPETQENSAAPKPTEPQNTSTKQTNFFRALGEVNEVREVLRRCAEKKIAFDAVEIICCDNSQAEIFYEEACAWFGPDNIPITFENGIPLRYSRPARALKLWLEWRRGFFQEPLCRMFAEDLVRLSEEETENTNDSGELTQSSPLPDSSLISQILRSLPIGFGRERLRSEIENALVRTQNHLARIAKANTGTEDFDLDDTDISENEKRCRRRFEALKTIKSVTEKLLASAEPAGSGSDILRGAADFLSTLTRRTSRLDAYAYDRLQAGIAELSECCKLFSEISESEATSALDRLCRTTTVLGQGPRPGALYISTVRTGAQSGRQHTFVLGLDDGRFPGGGGADPLLLDSERLRLSELLPLSADKAKKKTALFRESLEALSGNLTLSYTSSCITDERENYPASLLLYLYRKATGKQEADVEQMLSAKQFRTPSSGNSETKENSLDLWEWWISASAASMQNIDNRAIEKLCEEIYPQTMSGKTAMAARESSAFTEYDGKVKEAGADADPFSETGFILSGSRLETLARNPLEFFFKYCLKITKFEELELDPTKWLNPLQRGNLLHEIFRSIFTERLASGKDMEKDFASVAPLIEKLLESLRKQIPVPNEEAFERDAEFIRDSVWIFLRSEFYLDNTATPLWFEAAAGAAPEGTGTELDREEPLQLFIGEAASIRARGRLDRIDRLSQYEQEDESPLAAYRIVDYKTGSAKKYSETDPFAQGRIIQNALYLMLANNLLKEKLGPGHEVREFQYFFPTPREWGKRVAYGPEILQQGREIMRELCRLIADGAFIISPKADDLQISDYEKVFAYCHDTAENSKRKLSEEAQQNDSILAPLLKLRGIEPLPEITEMITYE